MWYFDKFIDIFIANYIEYKIKDEIIIFDVNTYRICVKVEMFIFTGARYKSIYYMTNFNIT